MSNSELVPESDADSASGTGIVSTQPRLSLPTIFTAKNVAQTGFSALSLAVNLVELFTTSFISVILVSKAAFSTQWFWSQSTLNGSIFAGLFCAALWLSAFACGYYTLRTLARLNKYAPVRMTRTVFLTGLIPWLLVTVFTALIIHSLDIGAVMVLGAPIALMLGQAVAMWRLKVSDTAYGGLQINSRKN